ncbi:hypothetical protein L2E82_28870, partial [Cichorium intybus]
APPDHRRAYESGKSKCKTSRVLAKSPSFSNFYVRVLHMHTFGVPYSPFILSLLPSLYSINRVLGASCRRQGGRRHERNSPNVSLGDDYTTLFMLLPNRL